MSYSKIDQVLPSEINKNVSEIIRETLREEYSGSGSALKIIARKTGANPRAIKNWYEGNSLPNLINFIALARVSPMLVEKFLRLSGYEDLAKQLAGQVEGDRMIRVNYELKVYSIISDTIKSSASMEITQNLNQRQMWFYYEIYKGNRPSAKMHAKYWNIGIATAKRDISVLVRSGLIYFDGAKKNGFYVLQ